MFPGDPEREIDLIWINIVFSKYVMHINYMKYEKIKKCKNKFVLYQLPEAYSSFRSQ